MLDPTDLLVLLKRLSIGGQVDPAVINRGRYGVFLALQDVVDRHGLTSVLSLRRMMEATGCIISGSYALLAFHPGAFEAGDLDLYVPLDSRGAVIAYFERAGFSITESTPDYAYLSPTIRGLDRLTSTRPTSAIDIVYTSGASPLKAIAEFHSTLLMNAITSSTAISFYPDLTLRRIGLTNYGLPSVGPAVFEKYRHRGFRIEGCLDLFDELEDHMCTVDRSCPSTTRSIHDHGVLSIPLDCAEDLSSNTPTTLVWKLANASCFPGEPDGFTLGPKGDLCEFSILHLIFINYIICSSAGDTSIDSGSPNRRVRP